MPATKEKAVKLFASAVIGLITLKVAVAIITGSISILAQAADSLLDLFAVLVTFLAIVVANRPADEEHPFGHGKAEDVAATIQAMLIFTAGGLIIYSAVRRIITGTTVELTEAGMGVMVISIIISFFLSRFLLRVARATDSMALEASARNIAADVYSAAGVLIGLVAIRLTQRSIIDPIIALAVSLLILKSGYSVIRKSFGGLLDTKLPKTEEAKIKACITEHYAEVVSFHKLRTRKAGSQRYIDLHLVMPKHASVDRAHQMCDHLEVDIENRLHHTSVTIHVEPCSIECEQCQVVCTLRQTSP